MIDLKPGEALFVLYRTGEFFEAVYVSVVITPDGSR
jgi:hypothetical protein